MEPFPRAARYDLAWAIEHSFGENVLQLAEAAAEALALRPGARVLDAGCGRAISSIFLAREYGARVVAADRDVPQAENTRRIAEAGVAANVVAWQGDVTTLEDEAGFDAIVCLDSFYEFAIHPPEALPRICALLRPGGTLCIVDAAFLREVNASEVPPAAQRAWVEDYSQVLTIARLLAVFEAAGLAVERAEPLAATDVIRDGHARARADDPAEASVIAFQRAMPVVTALVVGRKR